jgi:hypothetical protein
MAAGTNTSKLTGEDLRIHTFAQTAEGHWEAEVSFNGSEPVRVWNRHGGWTTVPDEDGVMRELLPVFRARLQAELAGRTGGDASPPAPRPARRAA